MSTKPILFSTPMVQAILDGRKTMTRRVIKPQPDCPYVGFDNWRDSPKNAERLGKIRKTPCAPGDILWVRETWTAMRDMETGHTDYFYAAEKKDFDTVCATTLCDDDGFDTGRPFPWKPSIHMPKKIARIFLRVTDVRVEKLQDITLKDIEREGLYCDLEYADPTRTCHYAYEPGMRIHFTKLWDSHAPHGYGWDKNPWVWVYSFERVDKPAGWPGGEGGE